MPVKSLDSTNECTVFYFIFVAGFSLKVLKLGLKTWNYKGNMKNVK